VNFQILQEFCVRRDLQKSRVKSTTMGQPSGCLHIPTGSIRVQSVGNALARVTQSENFTLTSLTTFETWTWQEHVFSRYRRFRISPKMNIFVGVWPANNEPSNEPIYLDVFDLTTGRQHPLSASSRLALTKSAGKHIMFAPMFRIAEDLIFVWWSHSTPSGDKVRITSVINWKTGELLRDDEGTGIGCPCPITQELLIRQRNFPPSLNEFSSTIVIEVQQLQGRSDCVTVARFLLPRLRVPSNYHTTFVNIQFNITELNEIPRGSSSRAKKLTLSPSSQLVFVTLGVPGEYYTLVTPTSTFKRFRDYPSDGQRVNGSPCIIPWDKWGPTNTRLLRTDCGSDQIHGHRLLLLNETGGVKEILDFNQLDIARDKRRALDKSKASPTQSITDIHIQDQPSVISSPIFVDDIETRLPYRTVFQNSNRSPSWHLTWILREDIQSNNSRTRTLTN